MKSVLLTLIRTGVSSTTKFKVEDFSKYLPGVANLLFEQRIAGITAKGNDFWTEENTQKRKELLRDIQSIKKANALDSSYFSILNRLSNGDRYGISNN